MDDEQARMLTEMQKFWRGDGWRPESFPQTCQHCYCNQEPPTTWRPLPHARCCKCGDVRLQSGTVICG